MENSKIYKIFELKDELEKATTNANKILTEQGYLIEALTNANLDTNEKKESINNLINSLKEQNEQISNKIESMKVRAKYVDDILFIYNQGFLANATDAQKAGSKFIDEIVSKTLIALGLESDREEESVTEE